MKAPYLRAERDGDSLRVWCEHCRRWHWHGGAQAGHRLAHCRGFTPYKKTGYVLIPSKGRSR